MCQIRRHTHRVEQPLARTDRHRSAFMSHQLFLPSYNVERIGGVAAPDASLRSTLMRGDLAIKYLRRLCRVQQLL